MMDNPAETKKRRISLSFKLNLLITIIVLLVSALLVSISYQAYTETAYAQVREKLDRVSMEKIEENPTLLKQCGAAYRLTRLDGFQEARAAMGTEEGLLAFYEWLTGYWVNLDTGDVRDAAAQEAALSALQQQAKDAGVPEEDVNDWMWENGREFYAYFWASNFYYTFVNRFSEEANLDDFSHIRIYAEDAEGWIQLADAMPAFMREGDYDELMDYGIRMDRAAAVEAYRERPEDAYITFRSDSGPEMAKVLYTEAPEPADSGVRFWFVYSCDIAKVEEGRKAFLLRSLLLVVVLVITAIGASLLLLRRIAVKPLRKLAAAVDDFSVQEKGEERKTIVEPDISSHDEIGDLARNFRSMQNRILEDTENLTRMTAEKQRISTELDLATRIQADMLPSRFPAFPDRTEFDLYAVMDPAKEVGGDFYDFFLVDDDHLALVIADVSGKGIPAALFMMVSKIITKNLAKSGLSPAHALGQLNEQLLENNSEDMFVTVWLGVLELSTGKLTAANAGHEYPFVLRPGAGFQIFKDPHGFVVGTMPGMKYRDYVLELAAGSKLFVYTDGVPEATDAGLELFGSERLLAALNESAEEAPEGILRHVRERIDAFVGEAEQFDDLTMLCLEYRGKDAPTPQPLPDAGP